MSSSSSSSSSSSADNSPKDNPAGTHCAATPPSSDSNSSLKATSNEGDWLQMLAAAVAVQWRGVPSRVDVYYAQKAQDTATLEAAAKRFYVVLQLLLLLVQQLQGAAPRQRAAFLHSPGGTFVLHVLGEMVPEIITSWEPVMEVLMETGSQQAAIGQQQKAAVPGWVNHWFHARAAMELLLLPGLLLQPVLRMGSSESGGAETASSSKPGGSSTASEQQQDAIKQGAAGTSSSSSSSGSSSSRGLCDPSYPSSNASIEQGARLSASVGTAAFTSRPHCVVALQGECLIPTLSQTALYLY
jgi:hypothetical protein